MSDNDVEGCCCRGRDTVGRRCMCLPYDDGFMISAKIISIVAFSIAWFYWVAFIISIIAMVLLQIVWCCRQRRIEVWASITVSSIASLLCFGAGIFIIVAWKNAKYCEPFLFYSYFDDDYYYDWCPEHVWAAIAFIDGVLWGIAAAFMLYFLRSGRYDRWEDKHTANPTENSVDVGATPTAMAVKMGNIGEGEHARTSAEATSTAVATTQAIATICLENPKEDCRE
mmetsp:Transcript_10681/g.22560  ORF Transcript_10681/g.22560 Transcript_10681/m.22560 type:complete len:226 (-) Transcript_10681:1262-1939(-)|eukprot:CAMPEP_0201231756 /NCGR_PEP_ID=MMETSP0852-20130820/3595_1 /ASSEMBLY_ACC=CAM_ASM_000632 /TAXON_ID=183588 /ORGANISM="Pseudo-nitzschia fraudulenta, Strain WWA7" /LENGTH=225 /DNA_ID=CAMNT_0047523759 /DNA_START=254 /DNA_END=931 /DNA_ORIENTATION=-